MNRGEGAGEWLDRVTVSQLWERPSFCQSLGEAPPSLACFGVKWTVATAQEKRACSTPATDRLCLQKPIPHLHRDSLTQESHCGDSCVRSHHDFNKHTVTFPLGWELQAVA